MSGLPIPLREEPAPAVEPEPTGFQLPTIRSVRFVDLDHLIFA